jgi:hypothetical protein
MSVFGSVRSKFSVCSVFSVVQHRIHGLRHSLTAIWVGLSSCQVETGSSPCSMKTRNHGGAVSRITISQG